MSEPSSKEPFILDRQAITHLGVAEEMLAEAIAQRNAGHPADFADCLAVAQTHALLAQAAASVAWLDRP